MCITRDMLTSCAQHRFTLLLTLYNVVIHLMIVVILAHCTPIFLCCETNCMAEKAGTTQSIGMSLLSSQRCMCIAVWNRREGVEWRATYDAYGS